MVVFILILFGVKHNISSETGNIVAGDVFSNSELCQNGVVQKEKKFTIFKTIVIL